MASNSREARRRRIVDKGSDRIALITGQIRNLQPDSDADSEPRHSHTASCPPYLSREPREPDLPSLGSIDEDSVSGKYEGENTTFPSIRKCESNREAIGASSSDLHNNEPPFQVSSYGSSASGGDRDTKQVNSYPNNFTPQKIVYAIKACESIRTRCSLAAAIIVVLCHIGFPLLGTRLVKSVVLFRPLFLLLLTNVSVVVGRLLLEKSTPRRVQQEAAGGVLADENDIADRVGKVLELGLMLQKILGAVFIDSSVYAISVICCLSFAQKLGW
ncbi:unnamed protein product [Cuscuta campestris]|uniref:Uncharacterized protein n=1 Tax=Cuscuta campestris TaxID=132261 RepID=A0A484M9J1_9ASTE|nr:unnamed protein product [Cuscuta campestris]